jgi:hypothetical protein
MAVSSSAKRHGQAAATGVNTPDRRLTPVRVVESVVGIVVRVVAFVTVVTVVAVVAVVVETEQRRDRTGRCDGRPGMCNANPTARPSSSTISERASRVTIENLRVPGRCGDSAPTSTPRFDTEVRWP